MEPDANIGHRFGHQEGLRLSIQRKNVLFSMIFLLAAHSLFVVLRFHHEFGAGSCNYERFDSTAESLIAMARENIPEKHAKESFQEKKRPSSPLNVVVFFPDDMSHKSLEDESGSEYVETPFLTALARDGMRFTRNAVTTSICWMSRATLFTGLYGEFVKRIFSMFSTTINLWS